MKEIAKILLIEDNPADIDLTLDAFREARLENEITVCRSGQEALDFLLAHKSDPALKAELPDIILLDLRMPGMSGHDVLKRIKGEPGLKRIPVIILTSSRDEGDRAMGYDSGANSYLAKPISFHEFLEVARQVTDYWLALNVEPPTD